MNPFTATLYIRPGTSKILLRTVIITSLVAVTVIIILPLHLIVKVIGCLAMLVWLMITLREHCWHRDLAIQSATLRSDDSWLVSVKGEEQKAELLPGCLVQPWLTVLYFKMPDRRRKSLILLKDNIDSNSFRRLRVRLKYSD